MSNYNPLKVFSPAELSAMFTLDHNPPTLSCETYPFDISLDRATSIYEEVLLQQGDHEKVRLANLEKYAERGWAFESPDGTEDEGDDTPQ